MSKKGLDIQIIVATHKKYKMPEDNMYLPLHVGSEGKESLGYTKDNTGDNISTKNPYYCELTGLYWAWKNIKADYIGLVHYRRYFRGKNKSKNKFELILTKNELSNYLKKYDVIVPRKRKYYIENIEGHYKHTMYPKTLDETINIIKEKYPDYENSLNKVLKRTHMVAFNMFIMKKEYVDEYCTWLFDILLELEKRMKNVKYDNFHSRFYGRISEILFNVWLEYKECKYKEIPFIYMEKINYRKKITSFFKAKFFGIKYDGSF